MNSKVLASQLSEGSDANFIGSELTNLREAVHTIAHVTHAVAINQLDAPEAHILGPIAVPSLVHTFFKGSRQEEEAPLNGSPPADAAENASIIKQEVFIPAELSPKGTSEGDDAPLEAGSPRIWVKDASIALGNASESAVEETEPRIDQLRLLRTTSLQPIQSKSNIAASPSRAMSSVSRQSFQDSAPCNGFPMDGREAVPPDHSISNGHPHLGSNLAISDNKVNPLSDIPSF